jgi:hypothetical protein
MNIRPRLAFSSFSNVDNTVSIHAKLKFPAVFRSKSSRFGPLKETGGAETGDQRQFEFHVY